MSLWVTRTARERFGLTDDWFGGAGRVSLDSFADAHALAARLSETASDAEPSIVEAADLAALDLLRDLVSRRLERIVEEEADLTGLAADGLLAHFGEERGRDLLRRLGEELGLGEGERSDSGQPGSRPGSRTGDLGCVRELLLIAMLSRHDRARRVLGRLGLGEGADPELAESLRVVGDIVERARPDDSGMEQLVHLVEPGDGSFDATFSAVLEEPESWRRDELRRAEAVVGLIAESHAPRFAAGHAPEPEIGLGPPGGGSPSGGPPSGGPPSGGLTDVDPAPLEGGSIDPAPGDIDATAPGPLPAGHEREAGAASPAIIASAGPAPDAEWMPELVLLAKNTLVWLDQLSRLHGRLIERLDEIPLSELERIASRGFNGLWLVGIWERSEASARIKRDQGQERPFPSAYAVRRYRIAPELGGERALEWLSERAGSFGIRLAADFVPNHTAIDADWVLRHPERFLSVPDSPFPAYSFSGTDLSPDPDVRIRIEDHYLDHSDAAVVFERTDRATGESIYVYHGNDGTSTPWNDTAQLDFLNPQTRRALVDAIVEVARRFSILRFDAAMTLARQHVHRLWYPAAGHAGAVPSRAEHGMTDEEIAEAMPREVWLEVVERLREEAPGTLLLAEAFWLMEGYFVRTLGLHRVYNSAFMHMVRDGKTARLRRLISDTLALDRGMLGRFVNYLSNPDEEPAVSQLGDGDRYIGACRLLVTLPGLPLFAHGQWEGLDEKYGMEFRRARTEDRPNRKLAERHDREIAPLLARRALFAGVEDFRLLEVVDSQGERVESVLAFVNRGEGQGAVVAFNNGAEPASGRLREPVEETAAQTPWTGLLGETAELADLAGDRRLPFDRDAALAGGLPIELGAWECAVLVASSRL